MSDIEQAAYDYGQAVRQLESADSCGAPAPVMRLMRAEVDIQGKNLLKLALEHFDNTYDGATA